MSPTAPTTAFRFGDKVSDPLAMYLKDVFTIPASLAGSPAMSIPVSLDDEGLPVGLQIMAPVLGEAVMFRAARALEEEISFDPTPRGPRALQGLATRPGGVGGSNPPRPPASQPIPEGSC